MIYISLPLSKYSQNKVVELKAVKEICDEHRAQLHNYLKATGLHLGF